MSRSEPLQAKLEYLETLVDALLEERNSFRADLQQIDRQRRKPEQGEAEDDELIRTLEEQRSKLAASEAANQRLVRERNLIRDRLTLIKNRLDQVEAKLLEQR